MAKRMYEIVTYKPGRNIGDLGATSGPFESRTSAERALTALFQSGQASDGKVYEIEVDEEAAQSAV